MVGVNLLRNLMMQYALQGLHDWRSRTNQAVQQRATACLGNRISSTEQELHFELGRPRPNKFFPMPKFGFGQDIEHCFFLPRLYRTENSENWNFVLFVLARGANGLAFRFEPASKDGNRHDYAHMQFCRRIMGEDFVLTGVPDWISERDPAFPLPSSDPVKLFLSMATAVHGRIGGVDKVIVDVFQKANQANVTGRYITLLNEMLDEPINVAGGE